ncbi:hypothetical protein OG394_32115 [Kribbella sp. NBC_01245]|uniref:hypothetical protein n=1 Tax=Kribbella sp. NBC_01245 TaxID=2903578 RepID=UPI002E2A7BF4|nr:hypothetical protein [Kribbella sp. NBC_01245]
MPDFDQQDDELGRQVADALRQKAGGAPSASHLASVARARIHRRRQTMLIGGAAVVVALAIGGVWQVATPGMNASETSAGSADSNADQGTGKAPNTPNTPSTEGRVGGCEPFHAIASATSITAIPVAVGLDLNTPVTGLTVCRYRVIEPNVRLKTALLGSAVLGPQQAQEVVDAIKPLRERNPELPVFKRCAPENATGKQVIVLRFDTAKGVREIWVAYDGCATPGFFTGKKTYGLYAAPLNLFAIGSARPDRGTFLEALPGW